MHPLNSALGKDENGRDIRVPSPDFKSGDPNYDGLKDLITPLFERSDAFVNKKIGTVSGTWDTISNYYHSRRAIPMISSTRHRSGPPAPTTTSTRRRSTSSP